MTSDLPVDWSSVLKDELQADYWERLQRYSLNARLGQADYRRLVVAVLHRQD